MVKKFRVASSILRGVCMVYVVCINITYNIVLMSTPWQ